MESFFRDDLLSMLFLVALPYVLMMLKLDMRLTDVSWGEEMLNQGLFNKQAEDVHFLVKTREKVRRELCDQSMVNALKMMIK